jgi:TolB-like protein/Tfp pilus assembly protein PilF
MPSDAPSEVKFEIGHVLFIDIVGYSKLLITDQSELLQKLKEIVWGTEQFRLAQAEGKLLRLPTGDGGALVFRNNPEAPVLCAMEISKELQRHPDLQVRMGIHSGPVNEITDLNAQANIAGAGINIAQRVMDCGDAGHILLSRHVGDDLEQYPRWRSLLHDLGECEVKHGVRIGVVNLSGDGVGNAAAPKKFETIKKHRAHVRWAAVAVALLVLGAIVGGQFFFLRRPTHSMSAILDKSIAVLPFENLSSDKENAFFTDGVQDEILTDLSKIADLKVISRTSVAQYRNKVARNLREIGQALGVAHLLEGSVQRSANRVRVNAQLIDARNDAHLWAQTYDRDLADVFAIQSEIAKTIADQLQAKLSPKENAAVHEKPTSDIAAYDLYLRALEIDRNRASSVGSGGVEGAKREVDLLNQAVSRDPAFVPALCLLATTHLYLYHLGADSTQARLDMARTALDAAARLQPDGGEVRLARALFYYWSSRDYAAALAELVLARRGLPNDARTFALSAYIERRQNNWEDATRHLEQAVALDPRNVLNVSELAGQYNMTRRYEDAAKTLDSARAWKPADFSLTLLHVEVDVAWKADLRRWREAVASESAKSADPNDLITARLNLALIERDYRAAEQTLAAGGGAEFDDNGFFTPKEWNQGIVARGLGEESKAKAALLIARERAEAVVRERPEDGKALMVLAQIDAALGRKEESFREGERAVELLPVAKDALLGGTMLSRLATIYAQAGDADRAFNLLEKVTKIPFGVTYGSLQLDQVWDPLRSDPRFKKIVESRAPKDN